MSLLINPDDRIYVAGHREWLVVQYVVLFEEAVIEI